MGLLLMALPLIIFLFLIFSIVFLGLVLLVGINIISKEKFKLYLRILSLIIIGASILVLLYGIITSIHW